MDAADFLIEPSELRAALTTGAVLIDARKPGDFRTGHIPGAMPLSTYDALVTNSALDGMREFGTAMSHRFSSVGVTMERPVIVYDGDTGMRAAREMWMLQFLGHRRVRMLHGGLRQWQAEGGPVLDDTDIATVRPKKIQLSLSSGCYVPVDEVARRAGAETFFLLDVRDDLEWAGKDNTPCCARRGHIPHAIHIEWTQFLENGRYKSPDAIIALLEQHGVNPHAEVVPYCHRGARSANTYYALKYAGVGETRNFIGSWHEWSARDDLPVAAGDA